VNGNEKDDYLPGVTYVTTLVWARTRDSAMTGQWMSAWNMSRT